MELIREGDMKPMCGFFKLRMGFFFSRHAMHYNRDRSISRKETLSMKKMVLVLVCIFITCTALAEEKRFSVPVGDSPAIGPANAPVTIIEFLDFQ